MDSSLIHNGQLLAE